MMKLGIFIGSSLVLSLSACGGGGGGASVPTTTYTWSGGTSSQDIQYNSSAAVTSYPAQGSGGLTATIKVRDTDSLISYGKFDTSSGTKTFDTGAGASIATFTNGAYAVDSNGDGGLFRADTYSFYGLWEKNLGSNKFRYWGGHAGSENTTNPASHVSSATYSGYSFGVLSEIGFGAVFTSASFSANANFSGGTMAVSSSGTRGFNLNTGSWDLNYSTDDFSGTLSKSGSNNYQYSGTVTNGYSGSGTANLNVYGPSANSVAGSAVLTKGDGTRKHVVAFGGTR